MNVNFLLNVGLELLNISLLKLLFCFPCLQDTNGGYGGGPGQASQAHIDIYGFFFAVVSISLLLDNFSLPEAVEDNSDVKF